ncbi:MAG: pantoate--beta-alanine ligase [Candidatus Marinimicrobia bacterium]|nr:pantoate--beta-alanine ligase [Candidatus Neomarinimicrobiota bacterium]
MKCIYDLDQWRELRQTDYNSGSLGFVPTMGALHKGHLSLVQSSIKDNDFTVVSIFLNPTQFNNPEDYRTYPRTFEADKALLENEGVDVLLNPNYDQLYSDEYKYNILESELSKQLCSSSRPGHFDGVLTVVMKLLNLVQARYAYFGEKDYQQYLLVKGMAQAFFLNTEIVPCPTVREPDGLAYSSRNRRLSPKDRLKAPLFYSLLKSELDPKRIAVELKTAGFKVDYVEEIGHRRYGAVYAGDVRLIDNVIC